MKKIFALLLSLCLILSISTYSVAAETDLPEDENVVLLSSLDNEECKQFLLNRGVVIPEEFNNLNFQKVFADIEDNPNIDFAMGWMDLGDFLRQVRDIANTYYGYATTSSARALAYTLQYSTLHLWNPSTMPNYNCYAYVLGRTSKCHPGDFSGQSYNGAAGITSVAAMVKDDLNGSLGYDCVKVQSSRPTSTNGWANVIAVRKDTTGDYGAGYNDYHFAKLSYSDWYHKPGGTAILMFNNAPSNSVDWTNEAYDGYYRAPDITYDSSIVYLLYKPNHGSTTYTYTGENYHSGSNHYYQYAYVCNDCGDYVNTVWSNSACSGPPCITPSSIIHEVEEG